jgi:uncharacterized UBP type Zn finger protein
VRSFSRIDLIMRVCQHLAEARDFTPKQRVCEECVKTGGSWVHLRICLYCGHVGCCDSSPGRHATKHFHSTQHPIMRSIERGETWGWCFVDEIMYELADGVAKAEVLE